MTYQEKLSKIKNGLLPKECVPKPKKPLNKISPKRKQQLAGDKDESLDNWFEERRLEMTGKCDLCGGKTLRDDNEKYRWSIHHLLDKRDTMFPSVKLHPNNWLELCFYGNSCHTNIHNGKITLELIFDSKERNLLMEKLKKVVPFINNSEYYRLPEIIKKALQ